MPYPCGPAPPQTYSSPRKLVAKAIICSRRTCMLAVSGSIGLAWYRSKQKFSRNPMARQVRGPTTPSVDSPACRWNRRTAAIVASSMVSHALFGRPSRCCTILTLTPFIPGVRIVHPCAATMVVVGCSTARAGEPDLLSVGLGVVRLGVVRLGFALGVGVAEVGDGEAAGLAPISRSDPQAGVIKISTTNALVATNCRRLSRHRC